MTDNITTSAKYKIDTMRELSSLNIPPRQWLLFPFIQENGLCMLYGHRGTGKTYVGLSVALSVASGIDTMNFHAEHASKVLYIDGEMPAQTMKERLEKLAYSFGDTFDELDNLLILTPDRQDIPMPNLSTKEGQDEIDKLLDGVKLLILDNLSVLCSFGRENEAESWTPMQRWILDLRRRGISVLLIDHAGKGGDNRGTSKKQDVLDSVICLARPEGYKQSEGARFILKYEKSRALCGANIEEYESSLCQTEDGNGLYWKVSTILPKNFERHVAEKAKALELKAQGKTSREIATEMGIGKTKAAELVKDSLSMPIDIETIQSSDERTEPTSADNYPQDDCDIPN